MNKVRLPPHRSTDPAPAEDPANNRRHWYFERRISMDTIAGVIGIAIVLGGPFIVWGRAMESRVLTIEANGDARAKVETEREAIARERQREMSERVEKIDGKVTLGTANLEAKITALQVSVAQLLAQRK